MIVALLLAGIETAGIFLYPVPTVVILVRHAERAAAPPGDPPLTGAGRQRAQTLVHVAGPAGVSAIFATEFQRTQQTVHPLAAQLGIPATVVSAADVNGLVSQMLSPRGRTVLAACHTDTIPRIIDALGGGTVEPVAETDFDILFVVVIPRAGRTRVVKLHYGDPT